MTFSVLPLGGVREIGKNMWLVSNGEELIMIDAGLKFPSEDMYGVNHLQPDMTYVLENQKKLKGIILTHAHEDHVGSLKPLLEKLDNPPPIFASELSMGLLEDRIVEANPEYKALINVIAGRERRNIGSFDISFLHVCHSISGALGLAIHTPDGAIVFTGDFKMDPTPIDQQPTDYFKFAELGEQGVLLLISDSTNATQAGYTISEKEVAQSFKNAFYRAKGRIIIASFASSLHRIQQIIHRCDEFGRKVVFIGRSMERMTARAKELGFLDLPAHLMLNPDDLDTYPPEKVVVVTTGSQGEPMAALSRMALGRFHKLQIQEGDTVIISATPIPGNERSVYQNVNRLLERKAKVIYQSCHGLHASGHASQEELKLMLNLTKPRYFIPTHGEFRQMVAHSDLAQATGISEQNIFLLDLGDRLEISAESAEIVERVTAGEIMVAGHSGGYLDEKELKERQRLVKAGVLLASVTIDTTGAPVAKPRLNSKGFIIENAPEELYEEVADLLQQALEKQLEKWIKQERTANRKEIEGWVIDHLSRIIFQTTRRRPMIIPLVHQLGEDDYLLEDTDDTQTEAQIVEQPGEDNG